MKRRRFSEEQIVGILREAEKAEHNIEQVSRQHGGQTALVMRCRAIPPVKRKEGRYE